MAFFGVDDEIGHIVVPIELVDQVVGVEDVRELALAAVALVRHPAPEVRHEEIGHMGRRAGQGGGIAHVDECIAAGHAHDHLAIDQTPAMEDVGRDGGTGTAGVGDAGASLPDAKGDLVGAADAHEVHIGPVVEVGFDRGSGHGQINRQDHRPHRRHAGCRCRPSPIASRRERTDPPLP